MSDFTICETSQPTAAAASAADRVLAGITRTSLAMPRRVSSSATRASLPVGSLIARVAVDGYPVRPQADRTTRGNRSNRLSRAQK